MDNRLGLIVDNRLGLIVDNRLGLIVDSRLATTPAVAAGAVSGQALWAQAQWEREGVRRAARRYQEAMATSDPTTLGSGQALLREVVPKLASLVETRVAEPAASVAPRWVWAAKEVDALTLALLTVSLALRAVQQGGSGLASIALLSAALGKLVEDEVVFRRWGQNQKALAKAAKEARVTSFRNAHTAFLRRYPNATQQDWKRSGERRRVYREAKGSTVEVTAQDRFKLGAALLTLLVESCPQRFALEARPLAGGTKTQLYLKLTEETQAIMRDVDQRRAVSRPRLMPMLVPPIPWAYP